MLASGYPTQPARHQLAPADSPSPPSSPASIKREPKQASLAQHQQVHSPDYHSEAPSPLGSPNVSPRSNQVRVGSGTQASLLDHFPELNRDGLGLSWSHDANNRAQLSAALMSDRLLIAGDISLAEMSRYPVPIMARPPLGVSDITLESWLQEVARAQPTRGVKLTFTSTRTVEPAFRVLARHADQLAGPLILSADILARPEQEGRCKQSAAQPVDAWTFLMLCRTRFPKSIISIGWCAPSCRHAGNNWEPAVESPPAESLFELDLLEAQLNPLGSLSQVQQRLQQHLHPFPLQRGVAAHPNALGHILSSSGSLNSSSGNSSGSPSPTSPTSHLLSPQPSGKQTSEPNELFPRGAAAAAVAAAVMAASSLQQQHHHQQRHQQLPLNLNINEADLTSGPLGTLAQKIHSYHSLSQHNLLQPAHKRPALAAAHQNRPSSPKPLSQLLLRTTNQPSGYTREMIDRMASLVKEYNLTQPVTFPVEARLLAGSLAELKRLLQQVGAHSTLTVVARQEDLISLDELLHIRHAFGAHQLLFDLPDELAAALRRELEQP